MVHVQICISIIPAKGGKFKQEMVHEIRMLVIPTMMKCPLLLFNHTVDCNCLNIEIMEENIKTCMEITKKKLQH